MWTENKHGEFAMTQYPCRNCIYFSECGITTRTQPCQGRRTKTNRRKDNTMPKNITELSYASRKSLEFWDMGYDEGYKDGEKAGKLEGFTDGWREGYDIGYKKAIEEAIKLVQKI